MSPNQVRESIWQVVALIPCGRVATYGEVARMAGFPNHARFVGRALADLPDGTTLPWHRVINALGRLSFPAHCASYQRQKALLEGEGVEFDNGRISLSRYGL